MQNPSNEFQQPKFEARYENKLAKMKNRAYPKEGGTLAEQVIGDSDLEQRYLSNNVQGIEQAYFTDTWGSDQPFLPEITQAQFVKSHDDNGTFIGSLPLNYHVSSTAVHDDAQDACTPFKLALPDFCNLDSSNLFEFLKKLDGKDSISRKTIEEINRIASEVDTVPEARQLIQVLSNNYKEIPEQLRNQFKFSVKTLTTPSKEPEYQDLSAYLNAPFPKIELEDWEENTDVKDILEKLKDLKVEDYDIPTIQVNNCDLTEKVVDGAGTFDLIATSIFNQLDYARSKQLISHGEIAEIYKTTLVQGLQIASQFALEKANVLNQSYGLKLQAKQAAIAELQAKAELMLMPIKVKMAYAELDAKLKEIELLKVQVQLEKEKFPQVVAQTDLILAQTDGQRLQNEQVQSAIQTSKLQTELTKVQLEVEESTKQLKVNLAEEQVKQMALANNQAIEQTKLIDAQTQHQLKQVKLADVQAIEAKARIKALAQQIDKEKEGLKLVQAQIATALAQLALLKDQQKASKAQISDTIDGKPIGGLLGAQILVNKVQASSFERKAFNDIMTQVQSGWAANKTADIAMGSPNMFTPLMVDRVMNWGMTKYFNMPNDIIVTPPNYTPYLSDKELNGDFGQTFNTKEHQAQEGKNA